MLEHRNPASLGTARQLQILLSVHEQQSITRAAKVLHLTQPSVSAQLAKLTTAIGAPLYYTVGKKLKFTEVGLNVIESARDILKCYEYLDLKLARLKNIEGGQLTLAVVTTAQYFIPHLVGDFLAEHPLIDITFKVGNRDAIIERTMADTDDFYVFSHPPKESDLELVDFLPNRLLAIAPTNHPLSKKGRCSIKDLEKYPFLMRETGSGTRLAIERFMASHGVNLKVGMTIESNEAIKHAVVSGLGLAILSEHTLSFAGAEGIAILDIEHLPIQTHWYLVRQKSRPLSPAAEAFLRYATSQVKRA